MRVAIAHDYLTQRGGAERVVLALARAFPDAPIHTLLFDPDATYPEFDSDRIVVSGLNRVRLLRQNHRAALPLLAPASNRMRIDADVVIASSSGWAHGFPTTGRKLVYCYSPARWLYQTDVYLGDRARLAPARLAVGALSPALRRWDRRAALSADRYLAISTVVARRIEQTYGIHADVVSAPLTFRFRGRQESVPGLERWSAIGFHLLVSRLLRYKNVEPAIEAIAALPDERMVVVGAGPLERRIRESLPSNVRLLSGLSDGQLRWVYAHAHTLVAPSYEDFGLTPLEAGQFGVPAVALRDGGYLDTVIDGRTGLFFDEPSVRSIREALMRRNEHSFDPAQIRTHVDRYSERSFVERIAASIECLPSMP